MKYELTEFGGELLPDDLREEKERQFARRRNEVALTLRLLADCIEVENPTKIQGFFEGNLFSASNVSDKYQPVHVEVGYNPYPNGTMFEIPQNLAGFMEDVQIWENERDSREDFLVTLRQISTKHYETNEIA